MDDYSNNTLTAFFDDHDDAEAAVARLKDLGVSDSSIRIVSGTDATSTATSDTGSHKGFWEALGDFFMPDEDRSTYAEGLRRGGYLVTVSNVSADTYDQVLDILDDEGSVDLDERSESWRSEGWSSTGLAATGVASGSATDYDDDATVSADFDRDRSTAYTSSTSTDRPFTAGSTETPTFGKASSATTGRLADDDEVIPVVKEELKVGKRDVKLGRVRVRSYVVEEPVSEQVNLRNERVEIERRPVDRAVEAGDQLFTDRVLEAEEHAEEAVISKTARVTEEIGLRRQSEERNETVSDTVRRTEVEIEDERTDEDRSSTKTTNR